MLTINTTTPVDASSITMIHVGRQIVNHNFDSDFHVEHFIKDIKKVLDKCLIANICLPYL
jgi:3-hydroxyisobutyrate dehydrogenase-like beta-hydroxyacid dehydrogenase